MEPHTNSDSLDNPGPNLKPNIPPGGLMSALCGRGPSALVACDSEQRVFVRAAENGSEAWCRCLLLSKVVVFVFVSTVYFFRLVFIDLSLSLFLSSTHTLGSCLALLISNHSSKPHHTKIHIHLYTVYWSTNRPH